MAPHLQNEKNFMFKVLYLSAVGSLQYLVLRIGFGTGVGCGRSTGKERIGRASERTGSRRTWLQLVHCALVHTGVLFRKSRSDRKGNRGNRSQYSDWRYRRKHLSIYTNYVFHMEQVRRDREWKS